MTQIHSDETGKRAKEERSIQSASVVVSIIIPIYNVEKYMDCCLESVTKQTYGSLEILLINDGSTDASYEKCLTWAKLDSRIQVFSKENEGLGPTREYGLKRAHGMYILYVDSDDWIEENTVELCMKKASEENAQIVLFDRYLEVSGQDRQSYRMAISIPHSTNANLMPALLYRTDTAAWDKFFLRSFLQECNLFQPPHPYEDTPVIPVILGMAERIAKVDACLYHYLLKRPGNITGKVENTSYIVQSLEEMLEHAKEKGIFEKYKEAYMWYAFWMIKGLLYHCSSLDSNKAKERVMEAGKRMAPYFPEWGNIFRRKCMVWGSYVLRSIGWKMVAVPENLVEHYGFSSVFTLAQQPNEMEVQHNNSFRKGMVEKEFRQSFAKLKPEDVKGIDWFLFDFLEERFDLINGEQGMFTVSDAFDGLEVKPQGTLCRRSSIAKERWQEKLDAFMEKVLTLFTSDQVIMVRSLLVKYKGEYGKEELFADNNIEGCNEILNAYYNYMEEKWPDIQVIVPDDRWQYCDKTYVHGCYPWHWNEIAYEEVCEQLRRR